MKLLVQEFLETHSFQELQEQHGVYASFSKSGHKFSLNYDQIEAKESDPLAQECRGLILSLENGQSIPGNVVDSKIDRSHVIPGPTRILAFPMRRFFNYGQGEATDIDWSDPKLAVLEKLDGTLCIVYWDPFINNWCVATRSVPEADLFMDNGLFTFRTLFEKAVQDSLNMSFEKLVSFLVKDITYCFELTTPYNRIVVYYDRCFVTLLAARHLPSLQELDPKDLAIVQANIVPCVQAYTYSSLQELIDWVSSLNPMEHEGVVVRDSKFQRRKVKNAAYVAYNKVRDALGTSERNCLELILSEKDDDVIPMLPEEIVKNLQKLKSGLQKAIHAHDLVYDLIKAFADVQSPGDKKTFALSVQKAVKLGHEQNGQEIWSAPLFQRFDGKSSNMKDFILKNRKDGTWSNSFLDKLLELSKIYSA